MVRARQPSFALVSLYHIVLACLLLSLPVFLPLRLPHDPSPRRVAGRPAGHQKSRLSEFQPEPANARLSLPRRGRPYRSFPENVRGDPRTPLGGCVWSRPFFPSRCVPCGPITWTTRGIYDCRSGGSLWRATYSPKPIE